MRNKTYQNEISDFELPNTGLWNPEQTNYSSNTRQRFTISGINDKSRMIV